jgi:dTDP-4-dehydrorhamnose reductase
VRILVTGAGGMLGQAVVAAARREGHHVVAAPRSQLDVTDADAVLRAVRDAAPGVVVNCAAWTDVDGAQDHEDAALRVNGAGAGNVARAAEAAGAFLVHVSTDYVFDGSKDGPYVETDPVAPLGAYGRTKLAGEQAVGPDHAIARTAWLFGTGGKNFVDTMLAVGPRRGEVAVVTDQVGCPTWTGHLAPALLEVARRREPGLHHLAGAGACSWFDLAREVFARAGLEVHVAPTTSEAFSRPAPRPANSVLASTRPEPVVLPPWQDGVREHVAP